MNESYLVLAAFLIIFIGGVIGRSLDPLWRCRQMRRFLRKNYLLLSFVQKNGITIFEQIVNAEKDIVKYQNHIWNIESGRIFSKQREGLGFAFKKTPMKWVEGVPTIFVDPETLKPLVFQGMETKVKSEELGSNMLTLLSIEELRLMASWKQLKQIIYALLLLTIIGVAISYLSYDEAQKARLENTSIKAELTYVRNYLGIPAMNMSQNGTAPQPVIVK